MPFKGSGTNRLVVAILTNALPIKATLIYIKSVDQPQKPGILVALLIRQTH